MRRAGAADAGFLARVALAASRSHVGRGAWDLAVEGSDETRLRFIEMVLAARRPSWCHHTGFLVAEVDGRPAAALAGYALDAPELAPPGEALREAAGLCGWSEADLAGSFERLAVFLACLPPDETGAWVVEWVAAEPEFRRRGLVEALLRAQIEEGRRRGHHCAQITLFIGNVPAQRAYEKVGFRASDERRDPRFEATLGAPGLLRMRRSL
jgi:ribosomal protein S18 acetylase RimI-like enzyme